MTAAPTSTLGINFPGIPSGTYVLFKQQSFLGSSVYDLQILSLDSKIQNKVMVLHNQIAFLTSDQSRLLILDTTPPPVNVSILGTNPYMINLRTDLSEDVPSILNNCFSLSYFPGQKSWIGQCDDNLPDDIYYKYGSNSIRLTNCAQVNDGCGMPQWSPDGQWIAYFRTHVASGGENNHEGLWLMNSSCLSKPETCESAANGPFRVYGDYSWSPDSKFIANADWWFTNHIQIYQQINGNLSLEKELDQTTISDGDSLAWSPDGQLIVYNSGRNIFMFDLVDGKQQQIFQSDADIELIGVFKFSKSRIAVIDE